MEKDFQEPELNKKRLYRGTALSIIALSLVGCNSYAESGRTAQQEYCDSEELVSYDSENAQICAVDDVDGFVELVERHPEADGGTFVLTDDALVDEVVRSNSDWNYTNSSRIVENTTQIKRRSGMDAGYIAPLVGGTLIDGEPVVVVSLKR